MSFKVIDIIFIVVILILGFTGLKKGFFTQIVTILGIIIGLFVAYFFSDDLSPLISKIIGIREWNNLIAFIIILAVIILFSQLLNKAVKESLNQIGAEGLDKILGFIFGLVQGLFICIGLTTLITIQPFFDPEPIFRDSTLGSWILSVLPQLEKLLPNAQELLENLEIKA